MRTLASLKFADDFSSSVCTHAIRQLGLTILAAGSVYLWIVSMVVAGALAQLLDAISSRTTITPQQRPHQPSGMSIDRKAA